MQMLEKGIPYDIPADGSLGLLALGAEGVRAWRKKRDGTVDPHNDKTNGK